MSNHRMVFTTFTPKIVSCPFCGHTPTLFLHKTVAKKSTSNSYFIRCERCGAESPQMPSMATVLELWNKRVEMECQTTFS